ncbi:PorT family protein [bacterium]|nr:PorT family protein [bacterium]
MRSRILKIILILCLASMAIRPLYAIGFRGPKIPNTPLYDSRLFHFGFSLGVNMMNFSVKTDKNLGFDGDTLLGIRHGFQPGFSVGVVTDLRMGRYFNLRFIPTFSMGQRSITYKTHLPGQGIRNDTKQMESIMVFLPLEVKWKAARMVNNRPYVTAGFQYTLDMASRKIKKKSSEEEPDEYKMKLDRHDVGVTVGVGWDFFLPYNNKIALELKLYFGLLNLLVPDNNIYTDRINSLTSRMLQINLTFE